VLSFYKFLASESQHIHDKDEGQHNIARKDYDFSKITVHISLIKLSISDDTITHPRL
jgi:hypothetical protein